MMSLSLSQRDTACRSIDRRPARRGAWLGRLSRRSRLSRLRRRGPRWIFAALLLLAADFVLAIIAWLIVEHIVR
jgi:hypothetical protein